MSLNTNILCQNYNIVTKNIVCPLTKKKNIKNTLKSLFSDNIHIATKKLFVNLLTYKICEK